MALHTLYVNAQYGNEVTLDRSMASEIDAFGDMTWRTLLTEVKGQSIEWLLEGDKLMDHFGIEVEQLDDSIDQDDIAKYYTDVAYYTDNRTGAEAGAFELLVEHDIFPVDRDGNGGANGVCLVQTTANGPRKTVYIDDEAAAVWLVQQFARKGMDVAIQFIGL
jgi:hypothetical protein